MHFTDVAISCNTALVLSVNKKKKCKEYRRVPQRGKIILAEEINFCFWILFSFYSIKNMKHIQARNYMAWFNDNSAYLFKEFKYNVKEENILVWYMYMSTVKTSDF